MTTLSCPHGSVNGCTGKLIKTTVRRKHAVSSTASFPRIRAPVRLCYNSSSEIGWSRWMGRQANLVNLCIRNRPRVLKLEPGRWSREVAQSGMFTTPSGNSSWLGKLLKLDRPKAEGDSQKTAVVDVHVRFSLSQPKNLADSVSRLAPRWFKLLKGVQSLLPHLLQNGGGGTRDGDFSIRLGYGGDDDSEESKGNPHRNRRLLQFYTWWAAGVASMAVLVWAFGCYSGIPQRTELSVSQFVDCMVWLGLAWCLAAVLLWAARMVVSFTPASQAPAVKAGGS